MAQDLDALAASLGFQFKSYPLDFARGPQAIAERKAAELKLFLGAQQAARQAAARDALLGRPPALGAGTSGASPTTQPAAAQADVQQELANEEMQRFAASPEAAQARTYLRLREAGINPRALAEQRAAAAKEADTRMRADVVRNALADPALDPFAKIDIAQNKRITTSPPQLVKVRRRDGTDVYMNRHRDLTGRETFTPALDDQGQPLRVPPGQNAAGQPTALQKNAQYVARVLYPGDPEAEKKSVALLTVLKQKSPEEAWASLVREVSKMQYGRYARDPQKLYDKTAEIWRVSRPLEPVPVPPPELPGPASPPSPAPGTSGTTGTAPATSSAPAAPPASGIAFRSAEEVRAAYRSGRISRDEALLQLKAFGFE